MNDYYSETSLNLTSGLSLNLNASSTSSQISCCSIRDATDLPLSTEGSKIRANYNSGSINFTDRGRTNTNDPFPGPTLALHSSNGRKPITDRSKLAVTSNGIACTNIIHE